jgi:tetrahydromethanopterin S-methyltransferase subunit E
MAKNRVLSELGKIESELKQTEIKEYLNMIESRQSFHPGLIPGLVFAAAAGFFAIIAHEIFIMEMSFNAKLTITIISGMILLLCLYLGLNENRMNKKIRRQMREYAGSGKEDGQEETSVMDD